MKKRIFIVLLLLAVTTGAFFFVSQKIKISYVECKNEADDCSPEVNAVVNPFIGKSYFSAKRDLSRVLSQNTGLTYFRVSFSLPSTLKVEVVEKKPEIALKFSENRFFLFDKKGGLVRETESTNLPVIEVRETPNASAVHFSVVLFHDLLEYYNAKNATLNKYGLTATVNGDVEATFPLAGDMDVLLGTLEVVLLQLNELRETPTIMGNHTGKTYAVDLRYKNPVVH